MDLGRARYRQAHELPPEKWDRAVLAIGIIIILALAASVVPS